MISITHTYFFCDFSLDGITYLNLSKLINGGIHHDWSNVVMSHPNLGMSFYVQNCLQQY